jgi:flagellar biosynthesis regulator FlbT
MENPLDWRSRALLAESEEERLRAENERLIERALYAEKVWRALGASREQLQAENERLRAELRTCQETLTACLESR